MKRILSTIAAVIALAGMASAQEGVRPAGASGDASKPTLKIGYINITKVIKEFKKANVLGDRILADAQRYENELKAEQELLKGEEALFASVAALLHAAERQFDSATRTVAVDEHLAAADALGDARLTRSIARPDCGDKAKVRPVREGDGVCLVFERQHGQDRAKHLVARERIAAWHRSEKSRRDVISA